MASRKAPSPRTDRLEGVTLGGYTLNEYVGSDSAAHVYLAMQNSLSRPVTVHVLKAWLHKTKRNREAFRHSAEMIARMEHPNIVPIYDYGNVDKYAYMVMRVMSGHSLKGRLKRQEINLQETAQILNNVGDALDYMHSVDVVHGTLSTTAILFDGDGNCYLGDLTFASLEPDQITYGSKSDYVAPERWRSNEATPATDQYALGIIAYRMLAGEFPFKGRTQAEYRKQHLEKPPELPQEIAAKLPPTIYEVLSRALAKNPEDRYPTIMDFAHEFEKASATPKQLFISYSRRDSEYAEKLTRHLRRSGFHVWIDTKIDYGDSWFTEIDEAVKTCAAFVLIMTPESEQSEWVRKEVLLAKRYDRPIFPLLLEGVEFPIVIDIQFADVRDGKMPGTDFHRRLRRTVYGET